MEMAQCSIKKGSYALMRCDRALIAHYRMLKERGNFQDDESYINFLLDCQEESGLTCNDAALFMIKSSVTTLVRYDKKKVEEKFANDHLFMYHLLAAHANLELSNATKNSFDHNTGKSVRESVSNEGIIEGDSEIEDIKHPVTEFELTPEVKTNDGNIAEEPQDITQSEIQGMEDSTIISEDGFHIEEKGNVVMKDEPVNECLSDLEQPGLLESSSTELPDVPSTELPPLKRLSKFSCKFCNTGFTFEHLLVAHLRRSHSVFDCPTCQFTTSTKKDLCQHCLECPQFKASSYTCAECGQLFRSWRLLNEHVKRMHREKWLTCECCQKVCRDAKERREHKLTHEIKPLPTKSEKVKAKKANSVPFWECMSYNPKKKHFEKVLTKQSSEYSTSLIEVVKPHKNIIDEVTFMGNTLKCCLCEMTFSSELSLQIHKKQEHQRPDFSCNLCSQWFVSRAMKDRHKVLHHSGNAVNASTHCCNVCNSQLKSKTSCFDHKRNSHSLYECSICGFVSDTFAALKEHSTECLKTLPKKSKTMPCRFCFLPYQDINKTRTHERDIHGVYSCCHCKLTFSNKSLLEEHREIHHNKTERARKELLERGTCVYCGEYFDSEEALETHHEEKHPVVSKLGKNCGYCAAFMSSKIVLYQHCRKAHKISLNRKNSQLCTICDATVRIIDLEDHKEQRHMRLNAPATINECGLCNEKFRNNTQTRKHYNARHQIIVPSDKTVCALCQEFVKDLRAHLKNVHETKKYFTCRFCPKKFNIQSHTRFHEHHVHPSKVRAAGEILSISALKKKEGVENNNLVERLGCLACDYISSDLSDIEVHIRSHIKGDSVCVFCKDQLQDETFASHMISHVPRVWKCKKCTFVSLGRRIRRHVCAREGRLSYGYYFYGFVLGDKQSYKCKFCEFNTAEHSGEELIVQLRVLKRHFREYHRDQLEDPLLRKAMRIIRCYVARNRESRKNSPIIVVPLNLRDQRFKCSECDFVGMNSGSLKQHKEIKHGVKIKCTVCNRILGSRIGLQNHMDGVHGRRNVRTVCPVCGKMVKNLSLHQVVHDNKRNFRCLKCPKRFNCKTNLKNHDKVHSGLKPFVCEECGKAFPRSESYTIHLRTHMAVKPFQCDKCSRGFVEKRMLQRHLATHNK